MTEPLVTPLVNEALHINRHCAERGEVYAGYGVRDEAALHSAIGAVFQTSFGELAYSDTYRRSAALLCKVAKAHAFIDGNKRTAFLLCLTYLGSNGIEICGPSPQAEIDFVKHVAESREPHNDLITFAAHTLLKWTG
ncbi:type II toxin-antitoxin system death-on-curing family toxin [Corynebacterium parakroppenstedtii]|uniref:type II toxin-antitoxin system death-on-curing family toxin n=1 Tax=Corynebacterium parakroppenstedtii TaxID=2828363 RepID=UPI001C8D7818|nr:type II toxin-antitoxin system death-on-curing family toxin [Corynebacterium parakroppenstedtii]MBY0789316.1 type II toxin-antitoxin system death-on-curing family toxin [Corynebacterium parakroppenstedtii]MBY0795271.1 type II toxin-antitoxin system death-on-curing family toxin [Corynebacterium parakroppenstedtii]MBY0797280.1 type II toxin-antitoxin system death-on-curing family toxin [Corynebacterium parakroppenstedtii]